MWFKQQTSISHSSGGWEIQDQGPSRFSSWRGSFSRLPDGHLLTVSSHGGERKCWSPPLLVRTLIPTWGSTLFISSKPDYSPKAQLPPHATTSRTGSSTDEGHRHSTHNTHRFTHSVVHYFIKLFFPALLRYNWQKKNYKHLRFTMWFFIYFIKHFFFKDYQDWLCQVPSGSSWHEGREKKTYPFHLQIGFMAFKELPCSSSHWSSPELWKTDRAESPLHTSLMKRSKAREK